MKKWISADPLGIDGGVNVYAYANLNPLFFVDPYGLKNIENRSGFSRGLDYAQGGLDAAGMWPAVGIIPDAINTVISVARGNWGDAAFNAGAMIPVAGQFSTAGKWAKRGVKYSDEAAALAKRAPKTQTVQRWI